MSVPTQCLVIIRLCDSFLQRWQMSLLQVRWRSYVGCLDPGSGWMGCLWADFDLIWSENVFQSWHFSRIYLVGNTLGVRFIWWLLFRPGNVQFPNGQDSWQICVCDGIEWWDRDVAGLFWWRTQLMWRNDVHLQDHYDDDMINMMMTWLLRWWHEYHDDDLIITMMTWILWWWH